MVYIAFLAMTTVITAAGVAVIVLVIRGVVHHHGIALIGAWALAGAVAQIVTFAICRALARWGGRPAAPVERRSRNILIILGIIGVVLALLAANFQLFGGAGPWREGRVVSEGGEFWLYSAGEKTRATALDFDMETRTIQLVPLGVAVFVAGLFQAYLAIDRIAPGAVPSALFAPWRLVRRGRRPDAHEELDAYNSWE
ncbi:hypothetical protein ACPPVW_14240 [Leifsonia sp. McL0607]|uniref:hypothetical protein n=1 Tax=Leifsonia sp. McL0607 TaxID=3415672 RepID=UPI003CEFD44D